MWLGADVVYYSCSKFLSGHSDVMAGSVVTNNKDISDRIGKTIGL